MPDAHRHVFRERRCPECGEVKSFPTRNKFCSAFCSAQARRVKDIGSPTNDPIETHDRKENAWIIEARGRIHTLEEAIEFFKVDLDEWEVERFLVNKWEIGRKNRQIDLQYTDGMASGSIDDDGTIFVEPLYQIKVWLKRKVLKISIQKEIDELRLLALSEVIHQQIPTPTSTQNTGLLLELCMADIQMGRLARGDETGWDNYDLGIAEQIVEDAFGTLLARTRSFTFDRMLFIIGNDLLDHDNLESTTTRGTPQPSDSRYHKVFSTTRNMIIRSVEILRQMAPVDVIVVPGNHDTLSAWHMGDSLQAYFHQYTDVQVDHLPSPRKYYKWGNAMLMFTHGDKGKRQNYPLIMATEQPEMFGATRFREIHTGHLHHTRVEEQSGIRIRILPSLAAPSSWESGLGLFATRGTEAYVWHKDEGLVSVVVYTVPDKYSRYGARRDIQ